MIQLVMQINMCNFQYGLTCHTMIGIAIDGDAEQETYIVKQVGKVSALKKMVEEQHIDYEKTFISHCGMVSDDEA